MELKEFIKGTIRDISEAVIELNDELSDSGLKVNPDCDNHVEGTKYDSDGCVIQPIVFDLQVTASEKVNAKGGFSINVLKAGAGTELNDGSVSRIHFELNVVLPGTR